MTTTQPATGPMRTPSATWTIVLAGLGVFMTALDNLVVTTALPVLRVSLHARLSGLEWILNAYLLAFACMILTGAALGDRFGRRRLYAIGIALFTAASAAAALSPSVGALIAARVFQGVGAGIAFPLTLTLISEAFPVEKRGAAIGMWGAIAGIAVAFGPVVGGAIIKGIDWHWIFWLNVPVGVTLVVLAPRFLSESFGPRPKIDVVGVALAAAGSIVWHHVGARAREHRRLGQHRGAGEPRPRRRAHPVLPRMGARCAEPDAAARAVPPARLRDGQRGQLLHVRRDVRLPVPDDATARVR